MIDDALRRASVSAARLDRIAVTTGPGGFTGVRIGVAMARGLALRDDGVRIPIVAVSSAAALAAGARAASPGADAPDLVAAMIDVRRGERFMEAFACGRPLTPIGGGATYSPAALADALETMAGPDPIALAGADAGAMAQTLAARGVRAAAWADPEVPTALTLAALAHAATPTPNPRPIYARPPDAAPSAAGGPAALTP